MRFDRQIKYSKIITLTIFIFMLSIFVSNAEIINKLSANEEIINEITENEDLNVEIIGEFLGKDNFMPGDIINNDKITLVNNENFPIKFALNLDKQGEELKDKLKVDIVGAKSILNNNIYELTVSPMESKDIYSNVSWIDEDVGIEIANKYLNNVYTISTEKSKCVYESYLDELDTKDQWIVMSGVLENHRDGISISSKKTINSEQNGRMYINNITKSDISIDYKLESNVVLDLSALIDNGRTGDGFDYYIHLNNKEGNPTISFTFHIYKYKDMIKVYCNNNFEDTPSNLNGTTLESNNKILKFKHMFYNNNGYLEAELSIEDVDSNKIYSRKLTKKGTIDETKWNMNNISDIRAIGFSGVKCNGEIVIKYLNVIKNE